MGGIFLKVLWKDIEHCLKHEGMGLTSFTRAAEEALGAVFSTYMIESSSNKRAFFLKCSFKN